jgi:hypothetical protein
MSVIMYGTEQTTGKKATESSPIGAFAHRERSPVKPQPRVEGNTLNLPICKQCRQVMTIARVEPDWLRDDGSEIQTFECPACESVLTRTVSRRDHGR